MTAKYLCDAEPGELVRAGGPNGPVLGLVAGLHYDDPQIRKLFICLSPLDDRTRTPCYMSIQEHAGSTALSFGREYLFVADPAAEAIDPAWGGDFYAAGTLIIGEQHRLLQVVPRYPQVHQAVLSYDIDAGSTVAVYAPRPSCAILKWEIRLKPSSELDPPLAPLLRFEIPSRSIR
jgi:hypothetical protein